ncbi:phosphotransferase [Sphingomonas sp. MMS24-JH45]
MIAAARAAGVPAPDVLHVCTAADGVGEAYVMRRIAGETLGKRIARDAAFAPARAMLARQCGAALAAIHATAPPEGLETLDAARTLANYEATWRASGAVRPTIEAAFRWLERMFPMPP